MTTNKVIHKFSVEGGELIVAEWQPQQQSTEPPVLAIHGMSASHVTFNHLARELSDRRLFAVDLRGFGGSGSLPGPYGLQQHVDDTVFLMDELGLTEVDLVAHSMGASVAVMLASEHADRVNRLVLVDGGLPSTLPPGADVDEVLLAVMGPTLERLKKTYPSLDAYMEERKAHPGLASCWDADMEEYVRYDLVGEAPDFRSSTNVEAMRSDARDMFDGSVVRNAWEHLDRAVGFIGSERGMMDVEPAVVPREQLEEFQKAHPRIEANFLPDSNHFSVLMTARGAAAIRQALEGLS